MSDTVNSLIATREERERDGEGEGEFVTDIPASHRSLSRPPSSSSFSYSLTPSPSSYSSPSNPRFPTQTSTPSSVYGSKGREERGREREERGRGKVREEDISMDQLLEGLSAEDVNDLMRE